MGINLTARLQEFRRGWEVVGLLAKVAVLGTPRVTLPSPSGAFYLLGWWWEGEHILVPEQLEEAEMASSLEEAFGPFFSVTSGPAILGSVSDTGLVVNTANGNKGGFWKLECIKIGITEPPTFIRKWFLKSMLGATYEPPSSPTKKSSPTPLSTLLKYLDSIET
jgi:hypothetical protein